VWTQTLSACVANDGWLTPDSEYLAVSVGADEHESQALAKWEIEPRWIAGNGAAR
jgi:hypothetical protein